IPATQDLNIEIRPGFVLVVGSFSAEGMAGGANAQQWFARIQMSPNERHHFLWRGAAANADEKEVGFFDESEICEIVVALGWAGFHEGVANAAYLQFLSGEFGQGFPGVVFIFAKHKDHMRTFVPLEMKGETTDNISAG